MENNIHNRLLQLIQKKGLNKNSFAKKIGVSSTTIQNIVDGRGNKSKSKPSFDVLNKIFSSFDDIDYYWFVTGVENNSTTIDKNQTNCENCEDLEQYKARTEELVEQVKELEKDRSDLMRLLKRFTS